jgi:hypothetical protein
MAERNGTWMTKWIMGIISGLILIGAAAFGKSVDGRIAAIEAGNSQLRLEGFQRLSAVESEVKGLREWAVRVEDKLDRILEGKPK